MLTITDDIHITENKGKHIIKSYDKGTYGTIVIGRNESML